MHMLKPVRLAAIGLMVLAAISQSLSAQDNSVRRGRNVIYITWDGFRWQEFFGGAQQLYISKDAGVADVDEVKRKFWRADDVERREALLPFVWTVIARQGQIFGDASKNAPAKIENTMKFSYPGYSEMFVGYPDDERITTNNKFPNPNVTVLEFLNRRPSFEGQVAAIATWDVFPSIINRERSGVYVHAGITPIPVPPRALSSGRRSDAETREGELSEREKMLNELIDDTVVLWPGNQIDSITFQVATEYLKRKRPRVLFIGLGETDEWGHGRRYDRYLNAAHRADGFLKRLWELLQSMPEYRNNTSLVIGPDHGRGSTIRDWTDHNAKVEGAEFIWSAVIGPDTPPRGVRSDIETSLSQIAATLAALVGEDFNAASPKSAKPLPNIVK
jgi:phosphopentomutase/2,3-bisphosphoglycerate-independent phosphoglycerate mutase family metalloenzyme